MYHNLAGLSSERDRYEGFLHALSEGGIPRGNIAAHSISGQDTPETVNRIMAKLFNGSSEPPTAIFAVNDHLAMVVGQHLKMHKEHIPQDVLLAGFDDLIGEKLDNPFITIRQQYALMGRKAAELLIDKIENHTYLPGNHVIPVEFVSYNL